MPVADPAVLFGKKVFIDRDIVLCGKAVETVVRIVEEYRAVDLCPVQVGFFIGRSGIELQQVVGVFAEVRAYLLLIVFHIRAVKHDERRAFLFIVAVQDRLFVVHAFLIGFVRCLGQRVAVHGHVVVHLRFIHELFGAEGAQLGDSGTAELLLGRLARFEFFVEGAEGVRRVDGRGGGAFQYHAAEQPLCKRRGAQGAHARRACRFAREGDVVGVAAKGADIIAHPFERLDLVEHAVVARRAVCRFGGELLVRKVAEDAQPIAHIDGNHALFGESLAAVVRVPRLTCLQRPAVNVDQHGRFAEFSRGLADIQVEGVLADRFRVIIIEGDLVVMITDDLRERVVDRQVPRLHAHRREVIGEQYAVPRLSVLRLLPSQLSDGRLGVGDTREHLYALVGVVHALQISLRERDDLRLFGILYADGGDSLHGRPCEQQHPAEQ